MTLDGTFRTNVGAPPINGAVPLLLNPFVSTDARDRTLCVDWPGLAQTTWRPGGEPGAGVISRAAGWEPKASEAQLFRRLVQWMVQPPAGSYPPDRLPPYSGQSNRLAYSNPGNPGYTGGTSCPFIHILKPLQKPFLTVSVTVSGYE